MRRNILADAPSRAPWEDELAQFLPIPDMPVRDLIVRLYQAPDDVEDLVSRRREVLTGEKQWEPLAVRKGSRDRFWTKFAMATFRHPVLVRGRRTSANRRLC